jgi:glyoxylase-like metal-dependent hydrolase (beta-lactamase superfamily II)
MTGPGTNTYLVGREQIAVIDPGPDEASHIDAIVAEGAGRIRWIVVTHTHEDHSPGATPLAQRTGAELWGPSPPAGDEHQDYSFVPQRELSDGLRLTSAEFTLRAVHTPGHVGNHYCLLLENEQMLMTGDHIMSGSTVVIVPPSGDMKDYLDSLEKLKQFPLRHLAPGHGELMSEPMAEVDSLIKHRLGREAKVFAALAAHGPATLDELVTPAYDDVPVARHGFAKYSLLAHLLKLERDARVTRSQERWSVRA